MRVKIDVEILNEIKHYCEYAGFHKIDDFIEESAAHILSKDKDFKKWKDKAQKN